MAEYKKGILTRIRTLGHDEEWLKDKIEEDPSILGLGDLDIVQRERSQSSGGRIDFLMSDADNDIRYEIEIMLGTLDESHIIRTIEYWDIERKRYPTFEHRAVIVAEDITNRFFNIISLFNQAIPIIALQLNAFTFEENVILTFTKVLDVQELGSFEEQGPIEKVDRQYWEKKVGKTGLQTADELILLVPGEASKKEITYNKSHMAIGTTGVNFLWLHPRKAEGYIHLHLRVNSDGRVDILNQFKKANIDAKFRNNEKELVVKLYSAQIKENKTILEEIFKKCEAWSRE